MPTNREIYEPIARQVAGQYGLDPDIFVRQINQESGFNPVAVSPAGARGIAQIMPATAKGWGVDPSDPNAALAAAAKNMASYRNTYLKQGLDDAEAYRRALAVYNAGPGAVAKYKGVPPYQETQNYINRIMGGATPIVAAPEQNQQPIEIPQAIQVNLNTTPVSPMGQSIRKSLVNIGGDIRQRLGTEPYSTTVDIDQQAIDQVRQAAEAPLQLPDDVDDDTYNKIHQQQMDDFKRISERAKNQPAKEQQYGLGTEILGGLVNQIGFNTRDDITQAIGDRPAFVGASILGNLGVTALGGLAGGIPGIVAVQTAQGAAMEAQRQRLQGEQPNALKALGSGILQGGTALLPAVKGATTLSTIGKNVARNTALGAGASVAQQAIEQGTLAPTIDPARLALETGLMASTGGVEGYMARPPAPLAPRPATRVQLGEIVPDTPPVEITTPSVRETIRQAEQQAAGPIDIDQPVDIPVTAREESAPQAQQTEETPQMYAVPETPEVKPVEYTAERVPAESEIAVGDATADLRPAGKEIPDKGIDAAFYDIGGDVDNPKALQAAREALPGYGDENLKAIGRRVKEIYDDSLTETGTTPSRVVEQLIKPKAVGNDVVPGLRPKPKTADEILEHSRILRGNREAMERQGVVGSVVKSRNDYKALRQRLKDMPTMAENRKNISMDLTPQELFERMQRQQAMINNGDVIVSSKAAIQKLERDIARLQDNSYTPRQLNSMRKNVADMEYRMEKQLINDQLNQIHPSLREAWDMDYDETTGVGRQKAGTAVTLSEVEDALTDNQYNLAKTLEVVANNDGKIRLDVNTEQTGATSRVGVKEFTPIGFRRTKDNYVSVEGYNEFGHIANYYITPKPNELGELSKINKVMETLNEPGFRGNYANVYKGIREFSIDDIMSRPPRDDGFRTSDAIRLAEKVSELSSRADIMAVNPNFAKMLDNFRKNPRGATVKTVQQMKELLDTDPKLLRKICNILGKAS